MGASKRGNSSRYSNSGGGSPGADAARNVGIVLGLGGLSFFLGFFVLSRMVPDRNAPDAAPAATPASAQTVTPAPHTAQTVASAPHLAQTVESAPAIAPRKPASSDVTIEPADETPSQKPASLDRSTDANGDKTADSVTDKMDKLDGANASPDATLDTPPKNANSDDTGAAAKRGPGAAARTPARSIDGSDATPVTPTRRTRRARPRSSEGDAEAIAPPDSANTGGISEGDQKPSRIDRDESDATPRAAPRANRRSVKADTTNDSSDEPAPAPTRAVKRSRYRVAAGSYAQREAAERAVHRVTDLGLDATVVPVTKDDGTTVYRVQQGVYRSRANAEAARQKLSDAGLDAEVVKTGN